jgi:hypothetical protein
MFNWDPAHVNNLGDKDARRTPKDEEKSNFKKTLDTIQWSFNHVTYGKKCEQYLKFCEANNIDHRALLEFSDTRFLQYCYYALRNFLAVYVPTVQKLDAENIEKNQKDESLNSNLELISREKFVLTLTGGTHIYRREEMLSQQCQK